MNRQAGNRTVLITGAAGGLGAALSLQCAQAGFNTVMLDKDRKALDAAWDLIVEKGLPEPALHPLDLAVAGTEQFDDLVNALETEFGGLDGLIHCAARFDGLRPLDQIAPAEWLQQLQVNLNAAWLLSVSCLPLLRRPQSSFLYFLLEDMARCWGLIPAQWPRACVRRPITQKIRLLCQRPQMWPGKYSSWFRVN